MTAKTLLRKISSKEILKYQAHSYFLEMGFEQMEVDINAAEFDIDIRYQTQSVTIPLKKRGNLSKYAGKKVEVVCTTISSRGARIQFFIRKK